MDKDYNHFEKLYKKQDNSQSCSNVNVSGEYMNPNVGPGGIYIVPLMHNLECNICRSRNILCE